MIIIDAVRRSPTDRPLAIRCQPYEHKFETVEPDYKETMVGYLGTSAIPGRWKIRLKVQMAASDTNAAKLVALANKAPEETVTYWMQFPVTDYAWWRRRAVPNTKMAVTEGTLCSYYPAILGVVTVRQTRTEGCYKEFDVQIEETRRLPSSVAYVPVQQVGLMASSILGAQTIYAQIGDTVVGTPPIQTTASLSAYNLFRTTYAGTRCNRVWLSLTDGSITLDTGWLNNTLVTPP